MPRLNAKTGRLGGKRRDSRTRLARNMLEHKTSRHHDSSARLARRLRLQIPSLPDTETSANIYAHDAHARPILPSAAPLLGGSARRAAKMKASSACEISRNEQN